MKAEEKSEREMEIVFVSIGNASFHWKLKHMQRDKAALLIQLYISV